MRIGIDPGHGTLRQVNGSWVKDIGTAAGSLGEYEANMKIALELYPLLRADGHQVFLSHDKIDWSKKLGPNSGVSGLRVSTWTSSLVFITTGRVDRPLVDVMGSTIMNWLSRVRR